ncbi:MAG: UDP-3-O-(3-hydroxymyristoyl)glucosamine N-acyltransferase [Planctomycetota bacterium]|nr:MAG: UDP-3-O-(3-hydroxymyristoyl)glucosamine N-acyltransferase [Planctomycetota bacterium]
MITSLEKIASHVGGKWYDGSNRGDFSMAIRCACTLETAGPEDITLVDSIEKLPQLAKSKAGAAIVPVGSGLLDRPSIEVADVHAAFASVIQLFRPHRVADPIGISPLAVVDRTARVASDAQIHAQATISADVQIGAGAIIHAGVRIAAGSQIGVDTIVFPNAVLYENTIIGARCLIHANAVLGAHGFGYKPTSGGYSISAQLGWVEIGDDVEIGAGSTIDRGTYGPTLIGSGTKIDNLVMIAHNCRLGQHNMICSQVGVAGSTSTGDWVVMAGQCGVRDHVHIGDRAVLGARSGVSCDVQPGTTVLGEPAIELRERKVQLATISKLPEMRKLLKQLVSRMEALEEVAQQSRTPSDRQSDTVPGAAVA